MAQITLKGTPINTIGELPQIGSEFLDFELVDADLSTKTLADFEGKIKVFNIFPSIDTGICAASARKFNENASKLENTIVINVSRDLPFALGRFCDAEGLNNVKTLSDFRGNFGENFGITITDSPLKGLLSRCIIIVDENNKIVYTEQVPEISQEPDYEKAFEVLK